MESPFYPAESSIFALFIEPILDPYSQTYLNVLTLSDNPQGPLANMVRLISLPKLTQSVSAGSYSGLNGLSCTRVLMKYPVKGFGASGASGASGATGVPKNTDCYMRSDDIPAVFSYLVKHGYVIDTSLTTMMSKSRALLGGVSDTRFSGDRKMVCMVSFLP